MFEKIYFMESADQSPIPTLIIMGSIILFVFIVPYISYKMGYNKGRLKEMEKQTNTKV